MHHPFIIQISELRQTASKKPPSVRDRGRKTFRGTTSIRHFLTEMTSASTAHFCAYAHSAITGEPGESLLQISAHSSRDVFTQAAAYRFAPTNGSLKTSRARLLLPGHGHCRYYSILSGACQVPGKNFFARTEGDRSPRIARKRLTSGAFGTPRHRQTPSALLPPPTTSLHFLFRKNDKSS